MSEMFDNHFLQSDFAVRMFNEKGRNMIEICKNCLYFYDSTDPKFKNEDRYSSANNTFCRRNPPFAFPIMIPGPVIGLSGSRSPVQQGLGSSYVPVSPNMWCGEYLSKHENPEYD